LTVDAAAVRRRSATTFAAVAAGALPVNPGEDIHRCHAGQADALTGEEPGQVHHVER
jgi:hypothetical protein